MTEINRKIHVIGINSYKFEDLPLKLQNLFIKTVNIAVPISYSEKIKAWNENNLKNKKSFFDCKSNNKLIDWLGSQKNDVIFSPQLRGNQWGETSDYRAIILYSK